MTIFRSDRNTGIAKKPASSGRGLFSFSHHVRHGYRNHHHASPQRSEMFEAERNAGPGHQRLSRQPCFHVGRRMLLV
jgi:hypothetical protein